MEILNTESFKAKIFDFEKSKTWTYQGTKPLIIDFYADWCAPCRALAPVLQEVADSYAGKIEIYKIDTQATPELAALFEVKGIPAILFVPLEGEPALAAGFMPFESFENAISDIFGINKK